MTTAKTFPKFSGKEENWERFCESFEATMVANTRYQKNALSLDDDSVVILKPSEVSTQTDADKKEKEKMRDHDLELYKILIDSNDVKNGEEAYLFVTGSKEDGYDKACFKISWKILKVMFEIATPQGKVTLKKDYEGLAFEQASQDPVAFVSGLDEIRGKLKKDYQWDVPLVTFLEDAIDRLPPEYKTKKEKWLEEVKSGSMKRMELMIELAKEHKALFPEYQKREHETALVMGGRPKMKCFGCGQWGHKSKDCPLKKSDGKSKDKSKGDKKNSSKKGRKESQVRCQYCKELGHIRPHCPKLQDKEKKGDRANDGASTHVDVVLAMDEGVEIVMDRENTNCGVCEVQETTKVACSPYEAPLMDLMRYPYMSPMRHEDSKDEDSLPDAKTVVAKTSKDRNCFWCR